LNCKSAQEHQKITKCSCAKIKEIMKIILIGKPGCGKGTQGKLLAEKYNVEHLSVGDAVRDILNSETHPLKERLLSHVAQQKWSALPDELACEIVQATLSGKQSWILDGFPRNIHQAEMLGIIPDSVLYLDIPDNESFKRISFRKREDDSSEKVLERLRTEEGRLPLLLEHYQSKGLLKTIDGAHSINEIFGEIQRIVEPLNKEIHEQKISRR